MSHTPSSLKCLTGWASAQGSWLFSFFFEPWEMPVWFLIPGHVAPTCLCGVSSHALRNPRHGGFIPVSNEGVCINAKYLKGDYSLFYVYVMIYQGPFRCNAHRLDGTKNYNKGLPSNEMQNCDCVILSCSQLHALSSKGVYKPLMILLWIIIILSGVSSAFFFPQNFQLIVFSHVLQSRVIRRVEHHHIQIWVQLTKWRDSPAPSMEQRVSTMCHQRLTVASNTQSPHQSKQACMHGHEKERDAKWFPLVYKILQTILVNRGHEHLIPDYQFVVQNRAVKYIIFRLRTSLFLPPDYMYVVHNAASYW